ncbi:MAG: 6-carboxytetrahydropterin synthase [Chloroflexi bacterium]|nr:6-carboxytetrahydropterin synthase [Chloroflexota bacterium]
MSTPVVHLSRRYSFSASHRLYTDHLSLAENEAIFGKCANPNGHGHNYGLTVTVAGPVDAPTGYVMPLDELDAIVRRNVLDAYDHRYLNLDVEDYLDLVPTGENIARRVWERLEGDLGGLLRRVVVDETRNNRFEYPAV